MTDFELEQEHEQQRGESYFTTSFSQRLLRNGLFLVHVLVLVLEMPERERMLPPSGLAAREFTVLDRAQTLEQEQDDREAGHALIASYFTTASA